MKNRIVILGYSGSNHIIRWAQALASSGFELTVLSCGGAPVENVTTINFGTDPVGMINYFKYRSRVRKAIEKISPDLIHVFQASGYGLWGNSYLKCPRVMTPLGSDITKIPERGWFYKRHIKAILKKYQYFAFVSEYLKNETAKYCTIDQDDFKIVPFGAEICDGIFHPHEKDYNRSIFLKHLVPIYGPDLILKALAKLKDRGIEHHVDFYGDDSNSPWLKDMADQLQISNQVEFKGWLAMEKIPETLLHYDFMLMPSRSESFGVAAVDAGAVGLPVIGTDIGGIPEIISDHENGLLVPPNDATALAQAMEQLIGNPDLRRKLGHHARATVIEKFDWQKNLISMIDYYNFILDN